MLSEYLKYLNLSEKDGVLDFNVEHPDGTRTSITVNKNFKTGSDDLTDEEYQRLTLRNFDFGTSRTLLFDLAGGIGDIVIVLETILALKSEFAARKAVPYEFVAILSDEHIEKFGCLLGVLTMFDQVLSRDKTTAWKPRYQPLYMKSMPQGVRPAYICMGSYQELLWASWGIPGKCTDPGTLISNGGVGELLACEYRNMTDRFGLPDAGQYVLLCPDAVSMQGNKSWPIEYWVDLIAKVAANEELHIVINSTNTGFDEPIAEYPQVTRFDQMLDFPGLAALIRSARCMVSVDTGPAHIAGSLNTPCITLWGPTTPVIHGHRNNLNLRVSSCPPCYARQRSRLCIDNVCMKEITSISVYELLARALRGAYVPQ